MTLNVFVFAQTLDHLIHNRKVFKVIIKSKFIQNFCFICNSLRPVLRVVPVAQLTSQFYKVSVVRKCFCLETYFGTFFVYSFGLEFYYSNVLSYLLLPFSSSFQRTDGISKFYVMIDTIVQWTVQLTVILPETLMMPWVAGEGHYRC